MSLSTLARQDLINLFDELAEARKASDEEKKSPQVVINRPLLVINLQSLDSEQIVTLLRALESSKTG